MILPPGTQQIMQELFIREKYPVKSHTDRYPRRKQDKEAGGNNPSVCVKDPQTQPSGQDDDPFIKKYIHDLGIFLFSFGVTLVLSSSFQVKSPFFSEIWGDQKPLENQSHECIGISNKINERSKMRDSFTLWLIIHTDWNFKHRYALPFRFY
jgi:hypothetical protein